MWKKALCLVFAFLLSIESMAAIVSDNDGTAFATKAEFEALKADFASQVEDYNKSIDGKIDGAIASYLAGSRLSKKEKLNSLLDKNGMYGQLYTYWSSATNKVFDAASSKVGVFNSTMATYEWDWTTSSSRTWDTGHNSKTWSAYLKSTAKNCWNLTENTYKYTTSKKVKYKEPGGVETVCYQRAKVYTEFDFIGEQFTEYFNVYTVGNPWTPDAPAMCLRMEDNNNKFVQDAKMEMHL